MISHLPPLETLNGASGSYRLLEYVQLHLEQDLDSFSVQDLVNFGSPEFMEFYRIWCLVASLKLSSDECIADLAKRGMPGITDAAEIVRILADHGFALLTQRHIMLGQPLGVASRIAELYRDFELGNLTPLDIQIECALIFQFPSPSEAHND